MIQLSDRFVLLREIGSGGMSRVFLGRDETLDRPVAVKVLKTGYAGTEIGARFRREGRTAAKLSHPNIVQVYDAGEGEFEGEEASFIVMEYVSGGDLKSLVDRGGPLPGAMLSRLGADVAAGLVHAHERGIVHRDIKPQNVLVDEHGSPKLTDFGVARALDEGQYASTSSYQGTVEYSSPEQLRREEVTAGSDVYSLGAVLYYAAVGSPPFHGGPLEIATQQMDGPPIPPRSRGAHIGEDFEALILDCLAASPGDRPDAVALREELFPAGVAAMVSRPAGRRAKGSSAAVAGVARAGTARAEKGRTMRRALGRRSRLSGPPEETITVPTRTFRSGARPRATLALMMVLLAVLLIAGAWAVLGANTGGTGGGNATPEQNAGQQQAANPPNDEVPNPAPQQEPSNENQGENGGSAGTPQEEPNPDPAPTPPSLPPGGAEQAVFDMYYEMSFARADTSWMYLSERLRNEIGSVDQWAEQQDIYTFTYMEFVSMPEASISGDEAEISFKVRLDHTWGSEIVTGTWVCVVEGGEWKLDRLVDDTVQPV